jgi:hypothetical protein
MSNYTPNYLPTLPLPKTMQGVQLRTAKPNVPTTSSTTPPNTGQLWPRVSPAG